MGRAIDGFVLLGALVAVCFAVLVPTAKPAQAHEHSFLPFLWNTSYALSIENVNTSFGSYISAAKSDWNSTDLTVTGLCGSNCGSVRYYQGNYGDIGWIAATQAYTGGTTECMLGPGLGRTGDCDKISNKADFAYIYVNTYDTQPWDDPEWWTRHEFGHVLGLIHNTSTSIMRVGPTYYTLQSHDISDVNGMY